MQKILGRKFEHQPARWREGDRIWNISEEEGGITIISIIIWRILYCGTITGEGGEDRGYFGNSRRR